MEREYIYIFKGDDTNWNNEQFVTVNVAPKTGVDLSDMTAKFMLGSYTKEYPLTTGSFTIDLSAAITGQYAFGPICGTIQILDSEGRIKTACNTIPFYITDKVIAEQHQTLDIDLPQGSPVSINLSVGGTVSYNDLTDKPSLNGVTIEGAKTSSQYGLANTSDIVDLQEQIDGKQPVGNYATQADLSQGLATKQNTLNAEGQQAVASGINAAKVASYDGHLLNMSNPHSVTKAQVGLGNADNTSDLAKPISTATQAALDGKQNTLTAAQQAAVDSGVTSSTVAQVQTNKENIAALDEELEENREWQKPADWVDIRSGALPNSGYFLVGHSADYATYPNWSIKASVSNSGTYDVFVDGIKQATTASGTETTLNWQTLALESGWDVTYPAALRTHIVRITPTDNANTFTRVASSGVTGTLWMHFNLSNMLTYRIGDTAVQLHPALEAITSNNNVLKVTTLDDFAAGLRNLVYIPKLDASDATNPRMLYAFYDAQKLKKIHLLNLYKTAADMYNLDPFYRCYSVSSVIFENCFIPIYDFRNLPKIKKLPEGIRFYNLNESTIHCEGLTSLQDTILDVSPSINCKRLLAQGSSSARCDGIKGITVSNEAPFTGSSPQINVAYTGLDRAALINLFKSMPYNVGYTVVGNPTIVDGVASGFSSNDYLQINHTYTATNTKNVEIYVRFKTPASFSNNFNEIITCGVASYWSISTYASALFSIRMGYDFDSATSLRFADMYITGGIQAETWYRIKVTGNNGIWKAEVFDDNGTLLRDNIQDLTTKTLSVDYTLLLQCKNADNTSSGSIDLNETYIKVNGAPWFTGKEAMTKTCDVRGCTGTADLTQDDKDIALNKGWELTVA